MSVSLLATCDWSGAYIRSIPVVAISSQGETALMSAHFLSALFHPLFLKQAIQYINKCHQNLSPTSPCYYILIFVYVFRCQVFIYCPRYDYPASH